MRRAPAARRLTTRKARQKRAYRRALYRYVGWSQLGSINRWQVRLLADGGAAGGGDPVTYTMEPTRELCWLHTRDPLFWVQMSNGTRGLYCHACAAPSHPLTRFDSDGSRALRRYERRIDLRRFWRRLFRLPGDRR